MSEKDWTEIARRNDEREQERQRDKITMAVMLAIGGGKQAGFLTMSDERRLAAGRVYGQVILPLLRKAWEDGYVAALAVEADALELRPNPWEAS